MSSDKSAEDAIKSVRSIFLGSLSVCVIWLILWPSAIETLERERQASELHRWLNLVEIVDRYVDRLPPAVPDSTRARYGRDWVKFDNCSVINRPVELTWPRVTTYRLKLREVDDHGSWKVYSVLSEESGRESELFRYRVVFFRGDDALVDAVVAPQSLMADANVDWVGSNPARNLRPMHQPLFWQQGLRHVLKVRSSDLAVGDSSELALQKEVDNRLKSGATKVLGIPLSVEAFFSTVGFLLFGLAFAILSPLLTLRSGSHGHHVWILAFRAPFTRSGRLLEHAILLVSVVWALAALAILVCQLSSETQLVGLSAVAVKAGYVTLIISSVVFTYAVAILRKVRSKADHI